MRVHVEDKGFCFYGHSRHWRQCLVTCGAVSEGRGCRFLTILCSRMYVSLDVCSNMLLIKCYVDYLFYYFKHFLVLLFLIICIFVISLPFCNIFTCSHVLFIMLCFICLYMFLSICLYIVSDDENKDDQSYPNCIMSWRSETRRHLASAMWDSSRDYETAPIYQFLAHALALTEHPIRVQ